MIQPFRCRETEKLYRREASKKFPASLLQAALRKLWMLDAAESLEDLRRPPGNRLECLHGDRQGQYSIRINNQFRLYLRWRENNASDVEIVDYH